MNLNPSIFESREGNGWLQFSHPKSTESFEKFTKAAEHVKSDSIRNDIYDDRQCVCLCCASRDKTLGIRAIPLISRIDRYLEFCSKRLAEPVKLSIAAVVDCPIGPYALMDLIGNDLNLQQILHDACGERFRPRPILK